MADNTKNNSSPLSGAQSRSSALDFARGRGDGLQGQKHSASFQSTSSLLITPSNSLANSSTPIPPSAASSSSGASSKKFTKTHSSSRIRDFQDGERASPRKKGRGRMGSVFALEGKPPSSAALLTDRDSRGGAAAGAAAPKKSKTYRLKNRASFLPNDDVRKDKKDRDLERSDDFDEVGLSVMSWSGQEIKATNWASLTEFHFRKMHQIFRRLSHISPPDLSCPLPSYAKKEEGGGGEGEEGGGEMREELLRFITNVTDALSELSDILSFLSLPWDMNIFAEIFHLKWVKVSFTQPSDVEHLREVLEGYLKGSQLLYDADHDDVKDKKKKSIFKFGKGKEKKGEEKDAQNEKQKGFEKSLTPQKLLLCQTCKNFGDFAMKYKSDPNGIIAGSTPCTSLLQDISHLSVLSRTAKKQKVFGEALRLAQEREDQNNKDQQKKDKKDDKDKQKDDKDKQKKPTFLQNNQKYDECEEYDPRQHVPVACLNLKVGYFPSREQMVQRMVLWSKMADSANGPALLSTEIEELAAILKAELWLEQVWLDRGNTLFFGDILIGIFPEKEINMFGGFSTPTVSSSSSSSSTSSSFSSGSSTPSPSDSSSTDPTSTTRSFLCGASEEPMLCRFVGAKRNGLLVEVGVHSEPVFLTWKQVVPMPEKWQEFVKNGGAEDLKRLVSAQTAVISPDVMKRREQRSERGGAAASERGERREVKNNDTFQHPSFYEKEGAKSARAEREKPL